ncbi:hypothetical protein K2173_005162 [Erythroxylum novogranatense]|uniref:FAD-binding domain-containing protein n=1 Tax=Erythroxylum novogranatense TaxID=1862640 RepID=A0AAV8TUG8_9ROSI|nr:hypothetical protein K2173_005162 [Erythroxylum novogranatense]
METMKRRAEEEDVVIIGGGIAGLATALAMKRIGIRALVLERSDRLRTSGAALSLFPNAWIALDALGVAHKLTSVYAPLSKGYVTNLATGAIQEVTMNGNKGADKLHGPRAVHRTTLLEALAEELPPESIRFSSKLVSIEKQDKGDDSIVIVRLEDGSTIKSKILIGCDGVHSAVAHWLGLSTPVDSGRSAVRGLSVYPQGHGFEREVRQFVDVGQKAGFVPLNDTELYWFFVCQTPPAGEPLAREPELIQREVTEKFAKNFPSTYLDVVQHAEVSSLTWAPLMLRYPWDVVFGILSKGNVTVAGDAMHPMTPDLGQGGCAALEDAVVLGRQIGNSLIKNGRLVPKGAVQALDGYAKERRWRAAALITASYISGRVQQGGERWWMKYLRDSIFYKFVFARMIAVMHHDCGKLPTVLGDEVDQSNERE